MSTSDRDLFIAYGALMSGALVPIYFGSYLSLRTPATTKQLLAERKRLRKEREEAGDTILYEGEDDDDDEVEDDVEDEEEEESSNETLTSEDAWLFPVFGSAVLFGMYLTFRYIDKAYINLLLSVYFGIVGVFAVSTASINSARGIVGRKIWRKLGVYKLSITKSDKEIFRTAFTNAHFPFVLISIILVTYYVATKNWVASNIVALSLATNAITLMGLDSFRTGMIMLGGLFLYDIFWVFGTEVMVSVAKNFDAPIKILWPKNFIDVLQYLAGGGSLSSMPKWAFTMLGLGDIVIPGIFVALALRFDQHQEATKNPSIKFTRFKTAFPKPYFHATVFAYVLGLATTMGVMHIFRAAQPALLYLSPACSAAVALTAVARGEWKEMWGWSDQEEEEASSKDKQDDLSTSFDGQTDENTTSADDNNNTTLGDESAVLATPENKSASSSSKNKKKKRKAANASEQSADASAGSSAVEDRATTSAVSNGAARSRGKGKKNRG
ncbi:hypothetical protein OC861_005638 [Tilletia horrida]|nr:hypothetical protein OC861_005638 [Tilletia horrida]